jgi:hypothetical protein
MDKDVKCRGIALKEKELKAYKKLLIFVVKQK